MPPGTLWIWWIAAALLALLGLGGLGVALFRDRSGGKLRCPKCWYSMEGVPTDTDERQRHRVCCPECGRITIGTRKLRKTRRRWRWAAVSLVPLAGAWVSWVMPRAMVDGWPSVVPTTVILLLPVDVVGPSLDSIVRGGKPQRHAAATALHDELLNRVYGGGLSRFEDSLFGWRLRLAASATDHCPFPAEASKRFKSLGTVAFSYEPSVVSPAAFAHSITIQTNIPCRFHEGEQPWPYLLTCLEEGGTLYGALRATNNSAGTFDSFSSWTIDSDGIVIAPVSALDAEPSMQFVRVYDLRNMHLRDRPTAAAVVPMPLGMPVITQRSTPAPSALELVVRELLGFSLSDRAGSHTTIKSTGNWMIVRGPVSSHLTIDAVVDAFTSGSTMARIFPHHTPSKRSPHPLRWDETTPVLYDLSDMLDAQERSLVALCGDRLPSIQSSREHRQHDFQEQCRWLIDPSAWKPVSPWLEDRMLVEQSLESHAQVNALLAAVTAGHGSGGPRVPESGTPKSIPTLWWRVYDTTDLWRSALDRADPNIPKHELLGLLSSKMYDQLEATISVDYIVRPTARPIWWVDPGSIVLVGSEDDHRRIDSWLAELRADPKSFMDRVPTRD